MWILDTDHITLLEHAENPASIRLRDKLLTLQPHEFATTIISYEEQLRGWLDQIAKRKIVLEQVSGYGKLHRQLRHFCAIHVLDFSELAATEFQRLRTERIRLATMDMKIAAIALSLTATLLTRNARDFIKVPNLRFEDWTKEQRQS